MSANYFNRILNNTGSTSKKFDSAYGMRIMKKYGWTEGKGLGAEEDGDTLCIQVKRREVGRGIGAETDKSGGDNWDDWWSGCFNEVASKIKVDDGNMSNNAAESDSESDSDDDDLKTSGVKKAGVQGGKLRRVLRQDAAPVAKRARVA